MTFQPGPGSAPTRYCRLSVLAGWGRSTGRETRSSIATWRSRFCRSRSPGDPDTLARFEREAKAVAALSHPNILAIHDFGNHEGIAYAVMELLEGETLRGKLDTGRIPRKQAVDYALQIAKGLSAAHEKGVVHRDLKPENLFVTRRRPRQDPRLRPREEGRGPRPGGRDERSDRPGSHGARHRDGDGRLHVARAGPRAFDRSALRHLFFRDDPLRAALGEEGVSAGHRGRHDGRDPAGRAAGAVGIGKRHPAGSRRTSSGIVSRRAPTTGSSRRRTSCSRSRLRRRRPPPVGRGRPPRRSAEERVLLATAVVAIVARRRRVSSSCGGRTRGQGRPAA